MKSESSTRRETRAGSGSTDPEPPKGSIDSDRELARTARIAGLRDFDSPTLESVERRRIQLIGFAAFMVVALAGGMTLLSVQHSPIQELLPVSMPTIRGLFLVFSFFLGFYLVEKERRLRRLTRSLMDERVLSAALSNRLKELSILSDVGKAINQVLDLDDVLHMILRSALELLEVGEGSVMLLDDSGEYLEVATAHAPGRDIKGLRVPVGSGISGWVAQHRQPLLISGRAADARFKDLQPHGSPPRSSISVPLIGEGALLGVLNVNDTGTREFSEYDLRAVGLFAEHAAIAIRNAGLYEKERAMVKRMEEMDQLKSDFIATMSHELRTPLTTIMGSAVTIQRKMDVLSELQVREFLHLIQKQGERLLRIIEDVLVASKIESGRNPLRRERMNLTELLAELIDGYRSGGVTRVTVDASEPVWMYGDRLAIEQIAINLMDNALKYSPSEQPVTVSVRQDRDAAVLVVKDRGAGIDPELVPAIFERFRQLESANTRSSGGVGLGLYIVKNLVEASGGVISVSSSEAGTTFEVRFPIRQEDEDGKGSGGRR